MNRYKPEYLGKVIPADNPGKLADFVINKYDLFSKTYDSCKEYSDKIHDIQRVESESGDISSFSMKLTTDMDTLDTIKKAIGCDDSINIKGDVITAVCNT